MDIRKLTLASARKALDAKEFSSLDLTNAYLKQITEMNTDIHAYLEVWEESARAEARVADEVAVRVPSITLKTVLLTPIKLVVKKLVVVAEVPVAFRKVKFWRVEEPVARKLAAWIKPVALIAVDEA